MPFGTAQDHKRVGDGDTGPNTGGMGAYSPARVFGPLLRGETIERIIAPTVKTMADEGTPYSGVLYAGLMLTAEGPKLIEYNCRFGDPECQVLMMRLEADLGELLLACAENRLGTLEPRDTRRPGCADRGDGGERLSGGRPRRAARSARSSAAEADGAKVFHAGTALDAEGGAGRQRRARAQRHRAGRDRLAKRRPPPIARCWRSISRAASTAATSASAKSPARRRGSSSAFKGAEPLLHQRLEVRLGPRAVMREITSAAATAPISRQRVRLSPRTWPERKPAANKSPAPVVSTTCTFGTAGTSARSPAGRPRPRPRRRGSRPASAPWARARRSRPRNPPRRSAPRARAGCRTGCRSSRRRPARGSRRRGRSIMNTSDSGEGDSAPRRPRDLDRPAHHRARLRRIPHIAFEIEHRGVGHRLPRRAPQAGR